MQEGVPHPLPEPFRVRDLLADQQPAEVRVGPADGRLHDARRNAEDLGQAGQPVVGVDADAGQRLDTALDPGRCPARRR